MENSYIDIETDLSITEVIKKLQRIIITKSVIAQTTYQQSFSGQLTESGAKLTAIEETPRNKLVYDLKFISSGSKNIVRISNNEFDRRQIIRGLLIGFCISAGVIILILGIIYYDSSETLILALAISSILIIPGILYKAKPLTNAEYLNDDHIKTIIKTINP